MSTKKNPQNVVEKIAAPAAADTKPAAAPKAAKKAPVRAKKAQPKAVTPVFSSRRVWPD